MRYSPARFLPAVFRKGPPLHLAFFVTRRCNARCPFCFYLASEGEPGEGEELSAAEVERLAPTVGPLLWLALSGGEIFLRDDLAELCRIFYRHCRPSIILLPTNGLLPRRTRDVVEEVLRDCPRSTVAVKLSLDDIGGRHDAIRGTPGGFEKVLRTHALLRELLPRFPRLELGVNTVFLPENQDRMEEIIGFVRGLEGTGTHTVSMVRGRIDAAHLEVDRGKYRRAAEMLAGDVRRRRYRFRGARVKAAQDNLQRRIIHRTLGGEGAPPPCYAGRLSLVLDETGTVYPCEILDRPLGNVRENGYDLRRVLASPAARESDAAIAAGCACTHECNLMINILFNPRLWPSLLVETLRGGK